MKHSSLQNVAVTGVPKTLKPFIDKGLSVAVTLVKVTAKNSPHKSRKIAVYDNHIYYDTKKETEREKFISQRYSLLRFHHQTDWETLVNGILQAKMGNVIKLYNVEHLDSNSIDIY
jgi:hypothetical protein